MPDIDLDGCCQRCGVRLYVSVQSDGTPLLHDATGSIICPDLTCHPDDDGAPCGINHALWSEELAEDCELLVHSDWDHCEHCDLQAAALEPMPVRRDGSVTHHPSSVLVLDAVEQDALVTLLRAALAESHRENVQHAVRVMTPIMVSLGMMW